MAANDMRIDVNFVDHPKVKRLIRSAGHKAFYSLMRLFSTAAKMYTNGVFDGCDIHDIEDFGGWTGKSGFFVDALVNVGFLEETADGFAIHDWIEHQPWLANAEKRSLHARKAIQARWDKKLKEPVDPQGVDDVQREYSENTNGNTPYPSPSPQPSPSPSPIPSLSPEPSPQPPLRRQWFNDFWEVYPRKQAKGEAEMEWGQIDMDESLFQTIMEAVEKWKTSDDWKENDGKYVPHPSKWLKRKGWEDEVKARRRKTSRRFSRESGSLVSVDDYNHI